MLVTETVAGQWSARRKVSSSFVASRLGAWAVPRAIPASMLVSTEPWIGSTTPWLPVTWPTWPSAKLAKANYVKLRLGHAPLSFE